MRLGVAFAALVIGCSSGEAELGDCADRAPGHITVGTGSDGYEPIGPEGVLMEFGPQGGYHIWVGIRCQNLDPEVTVRYGVRRADTGETLTPVGLERQVELVTIDGRAEAGGLYGYLNDGLDLDTLVGAEVTLWASVTDACEKPPVEGESHAVVKGYAK